MLCFKGVLGYFLSKKVQFCVKRSFQLPIQTQLERKPLRTPDLEIILGFLISWDLGKKFSAVIATSETTQFSLCLSPLICLLLLQLKSKQICLDFFCENFNLQYSHRKSKQSCKKISVSPKTGKHHYFVVKNNFRSAYQFVLFSFSVKISISGNLTENLNSFTEKFLSLLQTDKDQYFAVKNNYSHAYANLSLSFYVKISIFSILTENYNSLTEYFLSLTKTDNHNFL